MTTGDFATLRVGDSWDRYWRGAEAGAAFSGGGTGHPRVLAFWSDYFRELQRRGGGSLTVLDVASGNGAVVECASAVFGRELSGFRCLDVSAAAIQMLAKRFPAVSGVVADAARMPFRRSSCDVVTSQFGIEYAGPDAVRDVTRVIAEGGELALLLHHRDGEIYRQCEAGLDAIGQMQAAEFLPRCMAVFEAGFAALQGGDREAYRVAGRDFAPAIHRMEAIMKQHGGQVADGTILKLYRDIRHVHARMRHYEPSEVLAWLDGMQREIDAYAGRMASMTNVALDEATFERLCRGLTDAGFEVLRAESLTGSGRELPVARALVAAKR